MNEKIPCDFCGDGSLVLTHGSLSQKYNGDVIEIPDVEFLQCEICGEKKFLPNQEKEKERKTAIGYRKIHNLLTPSEIREIRKSLSLKQNELASLIGCGKASLSRWESGHQIQSRMVDNFLKLLRDNPDTMCRLKNGQ
jgi:putative zinc finger/helix-turn-helix YgiT family protein